MKNDEREKGDMPPPVVINIETESKSDVVEACEPKPSADFRAGSGSGIITGLDGVGFNDKVSVTVTGVVSEIGNSWDDTSARFCVRPESISVKKIEDAKPMSMENAMAGSEKRASIKTVGRAIRIGE